MTSIRDVAKLAGVSPSTVSRVMNGTARVDDEKKAEGGTGYIRNRVSNRMR